MKYYICLQTWTDDLSTPGYPVTFTKGQIIPENYYPEKNFGDYSAYETWFQEVSVSYEEIY